MKIILAILLFTFVTFGSSIRLGNAEYRSFVATAYCLKGRTASGKNTRSGIIAADTRVLPLGTRVHIAGHGVFVVADTGGAIKGNRIDIWVASNSEARKFGRRAVKLKVL